MSENKVTYKDIFRQFEYMKIIISAIVNRFGDSIDAIASTWIVYELTGSAAWSAIIFGINRVPTIFITPLAGAWVEGRNKKAIMVSTDFIRAACVAYVATGYLLSFLQPWMLIVTTLIISTAEAFRGPANMALTPKVLKKEYFEYGLSLESTLSSVAELIGTAAAAGIIAVIGTSGAIYVDMATFIISALVISTINTNEKGLIKQKFDKKEYFETLKDGFGYVKREKIILFFLMVCVFLNVILIPFNSLQAPLASEILGGGAELLSLLGITATVGMLLGSITYPMVQQMLKGKLILFMGCMGMAAFYIIIPIAKPLYMNRAVVYIFTGVLSLIMGYTIALMSAYMNVFAMKQIKEEYLARISGINTAIGIAAVPVASFVVSALVAYVDTGVMFVVSGILVLFIGVILLNNKMTDTETEEIRQSELAG